MIVEVKSVELNTKKATLRDVAKAAKVSIATVSRVINKNYYVSPEIENRVLKAKKDLDYFPNSVARSLKINSTHTIGFIVSDISNGYHITIARAVEDVIKNANYSLIMCSTENNKERELTYLELLLSKNIDALILNTTGFNDDFIVKRFNNNIPIILINRRLKAPGFIGDIADSNNISGTYLLAKQLLMLGHRRIFVIKGPSNLSNSQERYSGFKKAMSEFGVDVPEDYPFKFDGNFTLESGFHAVEYMCSLTIKPTAILSLNNMMTVGALKCLKSKNINAPEDVSIAGYDGIDNFELMSVRPTFANFDPHKIGQQVGIAVLERISNNSIENREFIFDPTIITGNAVSIPTNNFR